MVAVRAEAYAPVDQDLLSMECAGSPREMGEAQGAACADVLNALGKPIVEMLGLREGLAGQLAHAAAPQILHAFGSVARAVIVDGLRKHYPRMQARMAGMAAAAGIPETHIYCGPGIELYLNRCSYVQPGACTAVAVTAGRSKTGEAIIGKNFDYPLAGLETYRVRTSRPDGRAASIDVTAAPLAGCHEGINEHGLAITYNYGMFDGPSRARTSVSNIVQELLEGCRTVEQALSRMRILPRTGAAILMLADAGGDIASVELAPDGMAVRRGDALVHANHASTPEMAAKDVPHDAVLSRWNPAPIRGVRVHQSSEARHARGEELLRQAGALSEDDVAAILRDEGPDGQATDDTICRNGPYYKTTCSVILYPRRRLAKVVFAAPSAAPYRDFAL